jgi:dipeptidyl aminopeptidase/acylaminoacyl peptidase
MWFELPVTVALVICVPGMLFAIGGIEAREAGNNSVGQERLPGPIRPVDQVGQFKGQSDIGIVLHPGSTQYDAASGSYTVAGSGENMWFSEDAFHFVWQEVSGDHVSLAATINFVGSGGDSHRKALLMIRQSLDADSAYVDVAVHGDGLKSIQYRDERGAITREINAPASTSKRLRLEKRGDYFYMLMGDDSGFQLVAGSPRIHLTGPFYVGFGVCAHEKSVIQRAVFSNVDLNFSSAPENSPVLHSTLEVVPIATPTDRRVVYATAGRVEAPNWTSDGGDLIFNRAGRLEKVSVSKGKPVAIETGLTGHCNHDHGISPDGRSLAITELQENGKSGVFIVPYAGGTPRRVTRLSTSYWHGWSPDGKSLAISVEQNGHFDIYNVDADGANESRLTQDSGSNDGPEYSPDGAYIYFTSDRNGTSQIWRMRPDGSGQEQVTTDEFGNWFPHISPDGRKMIFLSYAKGVTGHPADKDVTLRIMTLTDRKITVLDKMLGGEGTINAPSWSPDSLEVAFVSYQYF